MSNDHQKKLAEFVEDLTTPDVPWSNAAVAFVAMKKRASAEVIPIEAGISERACGLMAHAIAEKFALQTAAASHGFDKLAASEGTHARYFVRKLAGARGDNWALPQIPEVTKLANMMERSIMVMQHLQDELGPHHPTSLMVGQIIQEDMGTLGKLAQLEQAQEKVATNAAVALTRIKQKVAQHSAISGGALRGPDPSGMRPRHEYRDGAPYTYHDGKDEGQPRTSKTASNTSRLLETAFETGKGAAKRNAKRKAARAAKAAKAAKRVAAAVTVLGTGAATVDKATEKKGSLERSAPLRQMVKLVKLAAEAGMSVQDYVGAEQQAQQQMEVNELDHVRQVAEQATRENQALSERAMMAEQQLQAVQQQLVGAQQQGQMAMQQASDSEANAAEQSNAKLRMKMKIDQMRQTLADLAAVNPQMDEAPGPEAGMPQPGAPAGPVQQQAEAAQVAAQQPQTAEQAKQMQQAQTAQNKAQEQIAQAQQAQQQGQVVAAQMPMNAGAPGAPAVAPAMAPTV